jgi:hypothetical protein
MLLAMLQQLDLHGPLLKQLTVVEAGRALPAVCRAAREAVRPRPTVVGLQWFWLACYWS